MATFEWKGTHEGQLRRALRVRHLVMLAVGGTIASGFLLFAGSAIGIAGPAVIISYVIAGIITVAVMACLAELAVQKPVSASPLYRIRKGAGWVRNLKWKTPWYPWTPSSRWSPCSGPWSGSSSPAAPGTRSARSRSRAGAWPSWSA